MHRGWGLTIDSLREAYVGYLRQPVLVLQGAVFLLLLIACANVAGLLLAQAVARQKEMGLRSALGSSRTRILRQVLTENVLLSCVAGAVGIGAAWVGLRTLVNTGLSAAYRDLQNVTLDWTVIAFALSVSLVTAVIFGILPALQISRLDVVEVVRDAGRSTTAGPAQPASQRVRRRAGGAGARAAGWDRATDSEPAAAQRGRHWNRTGATGGGADSIAALDLSQHSGQYIGRRAARRVRLAIQRRHRASPRAVLHCARRRVGHGDDAPPWEAHRVACCSKGFLAERCRRARPVVGGVVSGQR